MTMTIHKMAIEQSKFEFYMPRAFVPLSVQMQHNKVTMWYAVDDEDIHHRTQLVTFYIVGTGQDLPSGKITHLGTIQDHPYVWHIFVGPYVIGRID